MPKSPYKALMIDLDGTMLSANDFKGLPSKRVVDAIHNAQEKLHVGIITSRPLFLAKHVVEHLHLSGPSIAHSGGVIFDGATLEVIMRQPLTVADIKKCAAIGKKMDIKIHIDYEEGNFQIPQKFIADRPYYSIITVPPIDEKEADTLLDELNKISTLTSFKAEVGDKFFVFGTHTSATKQRGILEVAQLLSIKTHEIIGIGDSYNDFPLLMACGLKVAMGNAVPELKEIADYIAPSVKDDGVADVIEKFVL